MDNRPAENYMPSPLDPADWGDFRKHAHRLLDTCIDHLSEARDHPWRHCVDADCDAVTLGSATEGVGYAEVVDELARNILPFGTGNTHPRFFGWVHGSGLASGILSEIVAATMNSNCGGRDHGAVYVERQVMDWCRRCFGFPEGSSGLLVSGTSQATIIAFAVARTKVLGIESRYTGIQEYPGLAAYAASGVHSSTSKALELLGLGAASLRTIPLDSGGGIDIQYLKQVVARDRNAGIQPFCVIGTAGSVESGFFDDLEALADFCLIENIWFHVDGAFGAWARLAESPWRELVKGIERADSLAFDFHKWMYVQYDCGAVLIRDGWLHHQTFAARPAYLAAQKQGLGGGEPWYCDYGTDLSRGFRALKVWCALRTYGSIALGKAITRNCELASYMEALVNDSLWLRMEAPVRLNVCCFNAAPIGWNESLQGSFNETIVQQLQLSGDVVFSTTQLGGRTVIRAAIVNHRTCHADIEYAISAVLLARDTQSDTHDFLR